MLDIIIIIVIGMIGISIMVKSNKIDRCISDFHNDTVTIYFGEDEIEGLAKIGTTGIEATRIPVTVVVDRGHNLVSIV